MSAVTITGINEVIAEINNIAKRAAELDGKHEIPVAELMSGDFISRHTRFSTVDEMFLASGFSIKSERDIEAIQNDQWNVFIRSNSDFDSWDSMVGASANEWVVNRLYLR